MSQVVPFSFNDRQVRVVQIEGNPWFVAADVCRCLGAFLRERRGYTEVHTQRLRRVVQLADLTHHVVVGKNLLLISEPGLYRLILRSDKPEARQFQDWVTRVVLPAIRRDDEAMPIPRSLAPDE